MNPFRRTSNPHLLEIFARPWLAAQSARAGHSLTLAEIPDAELDRLQALHLDGIWLMGVWTTGPRARRLALTYPDLLATYELLLPDWSPADVPGSAYSIASYEPPPAFGGRPALATLRGRLAERGLGLMLDFVPNHHGVDHAWLDEHPDRLVRGTARDLAREPETWFVHTTPDGEDRVYAHGRDPHFAGWSDTVQLDYRRRETREAMTALLIELASLCDGLRCDVAMLPLPDVFSRTWGESPAEEAGDFWAEAIGALRRHHPECVLMAEVYWGLGPRLCDLGFDYAYDKDLYDDLIEGEIGKVRARIEAPVESHARFAHFLENHDELRARPTFGERLAAATAIAMSLPGLRFFHDGQLEGLLERLPVQLGRAPEEPADDGVRAFHERLLSMLDETPCRTGEWSAALPLRDGDDAGDAADARPPVLGSLWTRDGEGRALFANWSDATAKARVPLPVAPGADPVEIVDAVTGETSSGEMAEPGDGLSVELPPWGVQLLRFRAV